MADTIIDKAKEAIPWLHPNELTKRIIKLEYEHGELVAAHQAAAYEAEAHFAGAAAKRDDLAKRRDAIARDLENARAAMAGADLAAKQRAKVAADKERQARNDRIKKQLALRTHAARELADGLAKAVRGWRSLDAANESAAAPLPLNGLDDATFGHFSAPRLRALVEAELYRQGAEASIGGHAKSFPGGHAHPDLFLEDYNANPQAIPPLVETIGKSEAELIKLLDGGAV